MFWRDHPPPHFHARCGEHEAVIRIDTLDVLDGALPRRALALVAEWAMLHRQELRTNWSRLQCMLPTEPIAPLE